MESNIIKNAIYQNGPKLKQIKVSNYSLSHIRQRFLLSITTVGLLTFLVFASVLEQQVRTLTHPVRSPITFNPSKFGLPYEDVTLTTLDNLNISAWYIPGRNSKGAVIVHGLNAHKYYSMPLAHMLNQVGGYHVLVIDLRGHGESEGEQTTYGYQEFLEVQAAVDYLDSLPNIDHVGAVGYSLGGAAVVRAATADKNLEAMVLVSSYSSLSDAVDDGFSQFSSLPKWPFAPILTKLVELKLGFKADQVNSTRDLANLSNRPVLIMHSRQDDLFPLQHALKLYEAAQSPKALYIMQEGGHSGEPYYETTNLSVILQFLDDSFENEYAISKNTSYK